MWTEYEFSHFRRVGRDGYNRPIAHLYTYAKDGSAVDEILVGDAYQDFDEMEVHAWCAFQRAERDCAPHNSVDKTLLPTDDFSWHNARQLSNGRIRIETGYESRIGSREKVEEYASVADCFVSRWRRGERW